MIVYIFLFVNKQHEEKKADNDPSTSVRPKDHFTQPVGTVAHLYGTNILFTERKIID